MGKEKINLIILLSLIITFISLVVVTLAAINLNITSRQILKNLKVPEETSSEGISPSEVLNKKSSYSGKMIIVRGKVVETPVVCEKKDCPSDDACCGCPWEREIALSDEKSILTSQTKEMLRLLDKGGRSFCQRQKGSCRYECGDWKEGGIYEVYGEFLAEAPPPGWSKSLDFYFEVEDKKLVRTLGLGSKIGILFQEIKSMINNLKTSGYYVLP